MTALQQQHSERLQQAEQTWQKALASSEFADEFAFSSALLAQATQTLELHRQTRPEGVDEVRSDAEALSQSLAKLGQQLKALQQRQGEVRNQLESDAARHLNQQSLFEQINKASSSTMT